MNIRLQNFEEAELKTASFGLMKQKGVSIMYVYTKHKNDREPIRSKTSGEIHHITQRVVIII